MQSTVLLAATSFLVFAFLAVMGMNAGREIGLRGSDAVPSPSIPTPAFITAPGPSPAPHLHVSEAHRRLKPSSTGCTGSNARLERCQNNDEIEIVKEDNGNDSIDIVSEDNGNDSIDVVDSDTSRDQVQRNNKRSKQNNRQHSPSNSRRDNPKLINGASQQYQREKKKKTGNVRSWNPLNRNNNQSNNNNKKKAKKKKKSLRSRYNDFQKERADYKKWEKGGADAYVQKVTREHKAAYYKWEDEQYEKMQQQQQQPKAQVPQWQRTTNGHLQPRVPQVSSQEQKEREWAKMFEKQRQQDKEKAQRQAKGLKEEKARVPAKVQKMVTPARRASIKDDALDEINALLNFKPAPQPAKVIPKRKHDIGVSLDSNSDSVDARLNGVNAAGTTAGFNGEVGFDPNSQGNNPNRNSHDSYNHAFMIHQMEFDKSIKNGMTGGGEAGEALDYDPNAVNKDADNDLGNMNYPGTINTDQSKEVTTDFGDGTAEGVPDNDVPDN